MKVFFLFFVVSMLLAPAAQSRELPAKTLPPPQLLSQRMALIADVPCSPFWSVPPKDEKALAEIVDNIARQSTETVRETLKTLPVRVTAEKINGVPVYRVLPNEIAPENRGKMLLHIHGGGYILNPGEAGLLEAILMADAGKIPVVSVDYRLAPAHPYPAALDDVMTVYGELLKNYPPEALGVFGTSTGGGLALAVPLKARELGLPMPGALAAGTPWTDLSKTGDSYFSNEGVDNVLCTYDGLLGAAAKLYAAGEDLKNPMLSPVYGDVRDFPPSFLAAGTRDLFLSNTARMHQKMLENDVPAELVILEGLSHAQYMVPGTPEAGFYFQQLKKFFDKNLKEPEAPAEPQTGNPAEPPAEIPAEASANASHS